jgi:hypothetical protein
MIWRLWIPLFLKRRFGTLLKVCHQIKLRVLMDLLESFIKLVGW